jgi:signal transduction histidine kinase
VRVAAFASGHRVTVLSAEGKVISDSDLSPGAVALIGSLRQKADVALALDSARVGNAGYEYAGEQLLNVSVPAPIGVVRVSVPLGEPAPLAAGVRRDLLFAGALAFAVALILAFSFANSVSRPVIELRDVARSLAAGDLTRRTPLSAPGELGELSSAVNKLSEQLRGRELALHDEELFHSALFDTLHEGVVAVDLRRRVVRINDAARQLLDLRMDPPFSTDLLPRNRSLREALSDALAGRTTDQVELDVEERKLMLTARPLRGGAILALFDITPIRRLEKVRRDFVANVSHELRTPLTIIGGFAETLQGEGLPDDKRREFAGLIRSSAARLQRLVDDLLDLSRIESGGWTPAPVLLDAGSIVRESIAQFADAARTKGITLTTNASGDAAPIYADPTALRQILSNLLENAIRHTRVGGISIIIAMEREATSLSVSDTGSGIPPEHIPRIFERFYRADAGRARDEGGTGLGLAIVRHLAEAHGGRVSATSSVGSGTTVSVIFPNPPVRDQPLS